MRISRFYQQTEFHIGDTVTLAENVFKHAIQVLRLREDDAIILFNGKGGEYYARLHAIGKKSADAIITEYDPVSRESRLELTLAIGLIKADRMDWAIQKSVELGVTTLQPIEFARSVIKLRDKRLDKKMSHWQGIITSACEQSGRTQLPELLRPVNFESYTQSLTQNRDNNTLTLTMLPGATSVTELKEVQEDYQHIHLMVGPEGGFKASEVALIKQSGITTASWGQRILRAETAALAGINTCQLLWGK